MKSSFTPSLGIAFLAAALILCGCTWISWNTGMAAETPGKSASATLSPFGVSSDEHTSRDLSKWIPQMSAIGITNMRACRTNWSGLEPTRGNWSWGELDNQLNYVASHHVDCWGILYVYGGRPWGITGRPNMLPVNNLPAWSNYVSEVVNHANRRVRYWEVWNEPPNGTNNAPASDYAKVVVSSYDAVKKADPEGQVGIAAQSVHVNYLKQVIKAGAKDHFDFITLHPYEILDGVADNAGTEAIFMSIVPTVRKMLAVEDPANVHVPIWFTELGFDARKGTDIQGQALVKAYSMGIAQGVAVIDWFEGMDGDSGPMGLLQANGAPRPAYTAMAQLIHYLGTNPTYLGWVLLNGKDYGFVFRGTKTTVLVTWAPRGTPDHLGFRQPVQIVNPLTGLSISASTFELTTAPILVVGVPADLVTQARNNKLRPFPWNGDYSNATSVSISAGNANLEKGLHRLAVGTIPADVVAYGVPAMDGNIPGGSVFMVDPNFLSYTQTPIRITAVVRRFPANFPASIFLKYESSRGYTGAAAADIQGNHEWQTVTWNIEDSQFVSKWGFNFRFDSGRYYIKSVTVTKLANGPSGNSHHTH